MEVMRVLLHGAIQTPPNNNPPVDLLQVPIPPLTFVGLEGLDVWTKGALVFRLVPLWLFRLPQLFGHSRGHPKKVSPGEDLVMHFCNKTRTLPLGLELGRDSLPVQLVSIPDFIAGLHRFSKHGLVI